MSLEAMKQALAALENSRSYVEFDWVKNQCGRAITALSAAIDEAQPDARAHHKMMVAMTTEHWRRIDPQWKNDPELCHALGYEAGYKDAVAPRAEPSFGWSGAGFDSLPASPQWQGLTDAERGITAAETWGSVLIAPQSYQAFARAIEVKLREKNAL